MGNHAALHPTEQTLSDFSLGKLDDGQAELINNHLNECPDCQRLVAEMSSDSFLGRLQGVHGRLETGPVMGSSLAGLSRIAGEPASVEPPPASSLPPGLADHPDYEVVRELGQGGMGTVYLAQNRLMGRNEVLKVVSSHLIKRRGVLDRFLGEIRNAARLHHTNIVTAYSAIRIGESIIFAMEYVEGLDLSKLVKTKGPLPVANACNFVHQAALGLQHAHEQGMVHRDIKPSNLMLSGQGKRAVIKVLDFGLAKVKSEGTSRWRIDARRADAGHARLHRPGTDRRRSQGRHPRGHLQPGLHALLSADRWPAIPGDQPVRAFAGAPLDGRLAAEPGASGSAGGSGGDRRQDDGQGAGATIPGAERGGAGAPALLQKGCRWSGGI